MLLPLQGANPNIHRPRALPWAGCLLAFQAVTSQKLYRTPIICFILFLCLFQHMKERGKKKAQRMSATPYGDDCKILIFRTYFLSCSFTAASFSLRSTRSAFKRSTFLRRSSTSELPDLDFELKKVRFVS